MRTQINSAVGLRHEDLPHDKLFWSSRSPACRKVMIVAHELGVAGRLERERVSVGSALPNEQVMAVNPLNKIPTLVTAYGKAIYDSRVICRYLISIADAAGQLLPVGERGIDTAVWEAAGDGLADLSLVLLGESRRPEGSRSDPHVRAFALKMDTSLKQLEARVDELAAEGVTLGTLATAVAVAHVEFRHTHFLERCPNLLQWLSGMKSRPSFEQTEFEDIV